MAHLTKSLAVLASLGLAGAAFAQTTTTTATDAAPATTAPAGTAPVVIVPPAGMAGMDGMSGMSGMAGQTGMTGMDGMSGMSGMAGQTGMAGMDGMSGMTGAAPQTGMDGMAGMAAAPADGVGTTYTKETHGDWTLRCIKTGTEKDPCELYQLLKDKDGTAVAEISIIALPKGGQAVAGATLISPLETSLLEQVSIAVDTAKPQLYPFAFCTATGCVSRIGFTAGELAALKKGNKATVAVAPISAPKGVKVELTLSLAGFTAGFDAVAKANEGMDLQ